MPISFAPIDAFTPDREPWVSTGGITRVDKEGGDFVLRLRDHPLAIRLSILSPTCVRVRFNPRPGGEPLGERSHAVVDRALGSSEARIVECTDERLIIEAGAMRLDVDLRSFALRIFLAGQLICADRPGGGIVFRPGEHGIASLKVRPENALYCGFGEKAGERLLKNGSRMTNFNFDNFIYARAPIPAGEEGGPLNPAEPLYASIPLLIEINPTPSGAFTGPPSCYGLYFDNVSQSFFDLGTDTSPDRYAFGAMFGELDYYILLGERVADVLRQYTRLTGRGPMPPQYVFGFHQGCYGYFDRARLESVAQAYRDARIPLDGLHIDIDLQNNYRVFTHSEMKFPDAAGMLAGLRAAGFKCSTVVTPLITDNPLDERGAIAPFAQRQELLKQGFLLYDVRAGRASDSGVGLFSAAVSYGANPGINPYPYPPLVPNRDGVTPLGARMNYPDIGRPEVQAAWARQYAHLIGELGIDMIWQDMMCPAAAVSADTPDGTLPLDLMTYDGGAYVPHGVCHNAYAMFLLKATHAGLTSLRPDVRPFILARGGVAGLQRYAALWTGDNASSWDFLRIAIPQTLNLGLSGVPISGGDVGGFATGPVPAGTTARAEVRDGRLVGGITAPELFVRWMQAGSFLPWFRNHYLGYDKEYQEVYAFGEPVASICRRIVELRYRMLPLYYDAMYEWTQTGMPIARALFLNDPDDPAVFGHLDDQFFVGKDVLVAPILSPAPDPARPALRDVYLPAGSDWFAFPGLDGPLGPSITGGQTLAEIAVALDAVPIFVRAGAILPLRSRVEQYVGDLAENPIEIVVYPGPDDDHLLYQDDGITTRAERDAAFRITRISRSAIPGGTRVCVRRLHDGYSPPEPFFFVRLPGIAAVAAIRVNRQPINDTPSRTALDAAQQDTYLSDQTSGAVVVKVFDGAADIVIDVLTSGMARDAAVDGSSSL
ncbi:MAG: DUF4968 domain-containing protein [Rhodospirillales bacterium]|nr:DUF4968 domain-containing protein [Rhodospirillales bacterium]